MKHPILTILSMWIMAAIVIAITMVTGNFYGLVKGIEIVGCIVVIINTCLIILFNRRKR